MTRRHQIRATATITAAALAVTACSGGDGEVLPTTPAEGVAAELLIEAVEQLEADHGAVWGPGRALLAATSPLGGTAVVTATGVYAPGSSVPLHEFEGATTPAAMAIAPDGTALIVATTSPPRLLWLDLASGMLEREIEFAAGSVPTTLRFTGRGRELVVAGGGGLAAFPDGAASGPITLTDPAAELGSLAVLADGRVVAPLVGTTTVAVVDGLDVAFTPIEVEGTVLDAHATPDGSTMALSVGDAADRFTSSDRVVVLDGSTLAPLGDVTFGRTLTPVDWALVGEQIVVVTDTDVEVWAIGGDGPRVTLEVGSRIDRLVPIDGGLVAVAATGRLIAWESTGWTEIGRHQLGTTLLDVGVEPDRVTLTTVGFHGWIERWNAAGAEVVDRIPTFAAGRATTIAVAPDGDRIATGFASGRLALLDRDLADEAVLASGPGEIGAVVFNPATDDLSSGLAERVGATAFDDTVTGWDLGTSTPRFRLGGESEDVSGCSFFLSRLRFTSDGNLLATTSHDFTIAIVEAGTGAEVFRVPSADATVLDIAFTTDDDFLIVATDDGRVTLYETDSFTAAATYQAPMGGYFALAPLPDGDTMIAADLTGAISLVDVSTGEPIGALGDAGVRITSIALSDDGALLAAPSENATVSVWSVASGELLATLTGHTQAVTDLAFAPGRTWLASASDDGTIRTWRIATP